MAGGFLNRWSRRKAGEQVEPEKKPVDLVRETEVSDPNTPSQDQDLPAPATLEDVEKICLLYTSPSPRDRTRSRMPSSA